MDGKDEDDHQGIKFIKQVEDIILKYQLGEIASIHGRVYAMDRDNQWNRIAKSYQALVLGQGKLAKNAKKIIQESYNKEIYDQEFLPTVITKNEKPISVIQEGDSLIFFNVEKDATRELTESFVRDDFEKFSPRKYIKNLFFLSFSDHGEEFPVKTIYSKKSTLPSLSEFLIAQNWSQLKISGSRKYPHLNYFFNNKKEFDSKLETKKIITSTKLEEIAKQKEITEKIGEEIIKEIKLKSYNFILANLANFDCLPTEKLEQKNQEEILEYLETVDFQIEKIITSALNKNYLIVITSTSNLSKKEGQKPYPVPLLMIQSNWEGQNLGWKDFSQTETNSNQAIGNLNQVYPTILKALNLSTAHNKLNKPLF